MSKCKVCDSEAGYRNPNGGTFLKSVDFDEKYKCFVHRSITRYSLIMFCTNDPRSIKNEVRDEEIKQRRT